MNRAQRRRREKEQGRLKGGRRTPDMTYTQGRCRFPKNVGGPRCCICGAKESTSCPCTAMEELVHLERVHPSEDSTSMRTAMACTLTDSKRAPKYPTGNTYRGMFEAPCEDMVEYMTPVYFPTLAHYRWHALYDHLTQGACSSRGKCRAALESGEV